MHFKMKLLKIAAATALTGMLWSSPALAQSYTFTQITAPNANYTVGYGVNSVGSIIGTLAPGPNDPTFTFLDSRGIFQTISFPASYNFAQADGLNRSQMIVGFWEDSGSGPNPNPMLHGFLSTQQGKQPRKFASFDFPAATATLGNGVNDGNEIVGSYMDASGAGHAFTYKVSTKKFLNLDFPSAIDTVGNSVNNTGQIVGFYEDQGGAVHGFLSAKGKMTTLDFPTSVGSTEATAINNKGSVVGIYGGIRDLVPQASGFLYSRGTYSTLNYPGAQSTVLTGISATGEVLGYYYGTTCSAPPLDVTDHPCGFVATPPPSARH
jgi:probable HAF family extracellular repeat protein